MTEPNRVGGTRGPDGRTLTDVFNSLNQIVQGIASLPQILTALQDIRTSLQQIAIDTRRLSGSGTLPSLWDGLPDYLSFVVGAKTDRLLSDGTPIINQTRISRDLLNRISPWLTGTNVPVTAARGEAIYQALLTLDSGTGTPAPDYTTLLQNIAGGVTGLQAQLAAVSDNLGTISETPAGLPIKGVLSLIEGHTRRAADCCEDAGGGVDPEPPTNDRGSVETRCATGEGAVRTSQRALYSEPSNAPDEMYMLEFFDIATPSAGKLTNTLANYSGGQNNLPVVQATVDMSVCIDWNFTNDNNPAQISVFRFTPPALINSGFTQLVPFVSDDQNASQVYAVQAGQAFAVAIRVAAGQPAPGPNIWLAWEEPS